MPSTNLNPQYLSVILTLFFAVVMVAVSYLNPAPQYDQIKSLAFGIATDEDRARTRASWGWQEVLASAFILLCTLGDLPLFPGLAPGFTLKRENGRPTAHSLQPENGNFLVDCVQIGVAAQLRPRNGSARMLTPDRK